MWKLRAWFTLTPHKVVKGLGNCLVYFSLDRKQTNNNESTQLADGCYRQAENPVFPQPAQEGESCL